ncbi:Hsp70 family protein [Vagococcus sp. BWB3-3]|uniref:Chaperone protein DnaK n=1 Tax=Vagococcus allomyrinae TaxID=2794353 RepID=A0A940P9U3_9ENTE|nr:Hsp70 family protein [Vagococcus allomyrinae]MBP1042271.1 Hsp70 family protein [Vagococcus allomyrinae]
MIIIGIDLGTSNSLVGIWHEGGYELIPNEFGEFLTPSVVSIDDNQEVIVGKIAKEHLLTKPNQTAAVFKRFMGTEKQYQLSNRQSYSPTELSAMVIKQLHQSVADFVQERVDKVVVSVPAYFNNMQREDTIQACQLAGLECIGLISEPTAAALAYGIHEAEDVTLLVVDLGGGTYDVSLLELFDGVFQVNGIAGDNYLGGEDFTYYLIDDFLTTINLTRGQLSDQDMAGIYRRFEQLKQTIDSKGQVLIEIEIEQKRYAYELTKEKAFELWQPLLSKMSAPILRVLRDCQLASTEIDQVILIGGATKLSCVRQTIGKITKHLPCMTVDPDKAVGIGVTIQTALKEKQLEVSELVLTDVCAFTMGVEITTDVGRMEVEGVYSPIIERNSTIPISRVQRYQTRHDNQTEVKFGIYQGEHMMVKDNLKIGELEVDVPPRPAGQVLECRFTYDINGVLEVEILTLETNEMTRGIITNERTTMTKKEIAASFAKLSHLKIKPQERPEYRLILAKLERLYVELSGENRQLIVEMTTQFKYVLSQQHQESIDELAKQITEMIKQLEWQL